MTPKGEQMRVEVEKGKYIFFQKGHTIHVLRYGEKWCMIEKAAKAIIALMGELEAVKKERDEARREASRTRRHSERILGLEQSPSFPWEDEG